MAYFFIGAESPIYSVGTDCDPVSLGFDAQNCPKKDHIYVTAGGGWERACVYNTLTGNLISVLKQRVICPDRIDISAYQQIDKGQQTAHFAIIAVSITLGLYLLGTSINRKLRRRLRIPR